MTRWWKFAEKHDDMCQEQYQTIANWWNSGDRGKDDDKDKEDVLQEEVEVEEKPGVEG